MDELTKDDFLFLKAKGLVIKKLRIAKGYEENQSSFAADHGFVRSHYRLIESGSNMTEISIRRLLTHFDMKMPDFYAQIEDEYEKLKKNKAQSSNLKAI